MTIIDQTPPPNSYPSADPTLNGDKLGKILGISRTASSEADYEAKREQFRVVGDIAKLIFHISVVLTLSLTIALAAAVSLPWGLGTLIGGFLVSADFFIFLRFAANSRPGKLNKPLWVTISKFYLITIVNILVCFLTIRFKLGHPLGFLIGLGIFLPGVIIGFLCYLLKANKTDITPKPPDSGMMERGALSAAKNGANNVDEDNLTDSASPIGSDTSA